MHPTVPHLTLDLPVELYHEIIFFLDVKDVLALRKTCKFFFALTSEHLLWLIIFFRMRATQPLPCSQYEFMTMPLAQAERAILAASKVESMFQEPRPRILGHIPPNNASTSSWCQLTFISDRFLLSVDDITVTIWDTSILAPASSPAVVPSYWARLELSNVIGYVEYSSTLYIAVSTIDVDQRSATVYSVRLPASRGTEYDEPHPHKEVQFPLGDGDVLKHMDMDMGRALLYCAPNSLQVFCWRDGNRHTDVPLLDLSDDPDQLWDGITSLRFCGPYILCFKLRSVEAYPIPADIPTTCLLPVLRHRFGPVCFRAVSLSQVRVSRCPSGEVFTIYMLTNDVHEGMFHYRIRVTTSPTPSMSVRVLAQGGIRPPGPLPVVPGTNVRYTLREMYRRMFVSTWSLGSTGLHGVWVDRQRGNTDRRVVVFTTHPDRLRTKSKTDAKTSGVCVGSSAEEGPNNMADGLDEAPTMQGKVVHVISSYDLRDDVTICAVSEWTGRIAMVSREGSIWII